MFGLGCVAALGYALVLRTRLVRRGATDEELARPFPGADVIPEGTRWENRCRPGRLAVRFPPGRLLCRRSPEAATVRRISLRAR